MDKELSLGTNGIEHFENVEEVVETRLAWLKPGGLLVLGVPQFLRDLLFPSARFGQEHARLE